ncbi:hypothetical protein ACFFSW_21045 [Saccharothrix longispora]|uniref:FXSXX-COOH protein n=1 Tax=Saccharothrix longispora TaxID=33920 RepID=A0ABU1Q3H8_9PSEU|nr:hypothetical protein [Saccharothrix longispora]MDR6597231.1 hypothetical protein [Saccharothrix longispora]
MTNRSITLKLPPDLSAARFAAIAHTVLSVLDPVGLARLALVVDELATADELNRALVTYGEHDPRGR